MQFIKYKKKWGKVMAVILQTKGLTKKFGTKLAVDSIDMTINKGDIYGFIGKNGAGKTTFMRMVVGLTNVTNGTISMFDGMPITQALKKTGSLIEAPGIYKKQTAYDNLKQFSIITGGASNKKIMELLELVGLEKVAKNRHAGDFSLGMRQRLGIAIAMLDNPEFLVLDEPVNGLDPTGMKEIRELIHTLNKELGVTVLISSHLLDELSKTVTRYGIIRDGALVEEISTEELAEKSTQKLIITVDNPQKALSLLSQKIEPDKIQTADNNIYLLSHFEQAAQLNKMLCENGIMVSTLYTRKEDLEEYFLDKVGK